MRFLKRNADGMTLRRHAVRIIDTSLRTGIIMLLALPFAAAFLALWYYALYSRGIYFIPAAENIAVASFVPFLGVLFIFVLTTVFAEAWKKDMEMHDAINAYDFEAFMLLRLKHLHPLVYAMLYLVALAAVGGFMLVDYPDAWSGCVMVGAIAYLISITPFVLNEIDKPLSGIWYIKNVPVGWMEVDARAWLREMKEKRRQEFLNTLKDKEGADGTVKTQ